MVRTRQSCTRYPPWLRSHTSADNMSLRDILSMHTYSRIDLTSLSFFDIRVLMIFWRSLNSTPMRLTWGNRKKPNRRRSLNAVKRWSQRRSWKAKPKTSPNQGFSPKRRSEGTEQANKLSFPVKLWIGWGNRKPKTKFSTNEARTLNNQGDTQRIGKGPNEVCNSQASHTWEASAECF